MSTFYSKIFNIIISIEAKIYTNTKKPALKDAGN